MSGQFETAYTVEEPSDTEPRLTAFIGVNEADRKLQANTKREECAKILIELNQEAAHYCMLASSLGTKNDGDSLRKKLRLSRTRAWEKAKKAQQSIMPVLRRRLARSECSEELERMYRALSACLEFLEQQYFTTLLLQMDFIICKGNFINSGLSETPNRKKCYTNELALENPTANECLSVTSVGSTDIRNSDTEELVGLQREIEDLHDLVYSMNQTIAIQAWEIDPDIETEKFALAIDNESSAVESVREPSTETVETDNRKIKCVSIVIAAVLLLIIGGIVGILMGLLD
ncbi:regulator of G protein signaling 9 binding protein [Mactra antiquata]